MIRQYAPVMQQILFRFLDAILEYNSGLPKGGGSIWAWVWRPDADLVEVALRLALVAVGIVLIILYYRRVGHGSRLVRVSSMAPLYAKISPAKWRLRKSLPKQLLLSALGHECHRGS